jgi:hypothetical protein
MKIDELSKDLVIKPEYKNNITTDSKLHDYISAKDFTSVFNTMVEFLKPCPSIRRKFVKSYTDQPDKCNSKNVLLFSVLKSSSGGADNHKWIARMPLQKNDNSVLIYFPQSVIIPNADNFRLENKRLNEPNYHYAILINVREFIVNPEKFISIDKIKKRL